MKTITIAGGGLAGLFLGIQLGRRGVPVQIKEVGQYPRHRVCGEFINGQGLRYLRQQNLIAPLEEAGAQWAGTACFFHGDQASKSMPLPVPALCLARYDLDKTLAAIFAEEGGKLECGVRVKPSANHQEGLVFATGRQPQSSWRGWRWFGLKGHAHGVLLTADLEMHFQANSYVGICRLGNGRVNVCGLFRKSLRGRETSFLPMEKLQGSPGSLLHQRLARGSFDPESICSVAGLDMNPYRAGQRRECKIGDAVTMIPPLTGNGMSMAFESATYAVEPLVRYSENQMTWPEATTAIAKRIDTTYRSRLRWAGLVQNLLFRPWGQRLILRLCSRSERIWQLAFQATR